MMREIFKKKFILRDRTLFFSFYFPSRIYFSTNKNKETSSIYGDPNATGKHEPKYIKDQDPKLII